MRGVRTLVHEARSGTDLSGWTHARSYVGLSPANFVHRARLAHLHDLLRQLDLPATGLLVDLGCSDGFVIWHLRHAGDLPSSWEAAGYELDPRLVKAARRRQVPGATFRRIDLNDAQAHVVRPGDVVLCLETLEHVGDYRSALHVIHESVKPGGWIVLSLPVEVGPVGLAKLVARPLMRRQPYDDFFTGPRDVLAYATSVAAGRDVEHFRTPPRALWRPHLGFDHRRVCEHVREEYVDPGRWRVEVQERAALGAAVFLVARRTEGHRAVDVPAPRTATRARPGSVPGSETSA